MDIYIYGGYLCYAVTISYLNLCKCQKWGGGGGGHYLISHNRIRGGITISYLNSSQMPGGWGGGGEKELSIISPKMHSTGRRGLPYHI